MTTYADAGVDIAVSNALSGWLKSRVGGLFAGMVPIGQVKSYDDPVLLSSIDGVGTKVKLAVELGQLDGLGQDIVHHCVNDIAVHGAVPLFFLDYLAFHHVEERIARTVVDSIAGACDALSITLAGGETAEMPLTYVSGEFDIAGAIVGVAERSKIVDGSSAQIGDVVLGLRSSGPHTNGFSLIQSVFTRSDYGHPLTSTGSTLGEALLTPHRCYLSDIQALLGLGPVRGFAHITGGGIAGNLDRIIPDGLRAEVDLPAWPDVFEAIHAQGVTREEMARVFNLGIGLIAVCDPEVAGRADSEWVALGSIRPMRGERRVDFNA
jgi:phosphoribosylformylglycinamidine cyclo-ligase